VFRYKFIVILLFPLLTFSQNIVGKVYDNTTTVKGIKIVNITKNIITYSNNEGDFEIKAIINDSIAFYSLFHNTKLIKVIQKHFEDILVVELKMTTNQLEQVYLSNDPKLKPFNAETFSNNFKSQIAEDMKRYPYKYGIQPSSNIDFVAIAKLIGKLFKKKKYNNQVIKTVNYKEFDSLFSNNKFFNNKLLTTDLKIPNTYKSLFFDYCDAQGIDKKLLANENRFLLLEALYNYSKEFLIILSQYKKE